VSLFTDQVSASSDDASQGASGVVSTTATTNAMTTTYAVTWTGNRFLNVTIPNGATVSAADMSLDFSSVNGGLGVVSINCEDTATPATYATTTDDISSRTYTTAGSGVSWTMPSTTGYHASTDISPAAQAVFALAGWASGNNLAIGTECSTARASNDVYTYDNSPSTSAELSITYTASSPPSAHPAAAIPIPF
jgi:type IV pilus assembly protein PilY1